MSRITKRRIHAERQTLGDSEYELIVDLEGGQYFGRWTCITDGQAGASSAARETIPLAILSARQNALARIHFAKRQ